MTEIERRLKQAEENEKARSSYSETSDTARRLRIAEEQDRKYSAPEANRRAAMQRKTESWMDLTTEAEPEARAAIDRYKATEDAKYYADMNQRGATIGNDAMQERGYAGYKRAAAKWREGYHKGLNSESATDETLEGAQRKQNYWAEAAKQAAQFGDQARYNMAIKNMAKFQDDQYNLQMEEYERQKEEYEKNLDALRQSNPAEYYALTKSDDEIDRLIAYFDYENKNNAGRSGYGVTRTPEEEARYLNNLRRARFAGESDAERAAYIRAEQERYQAASKSYENRRTVMDDTTGRTLRTVADDPHWVEYFDRTPEEQAEYINNLRRARFVGESDAEREAYIHGEKDLYAEQLRNYQNGPDYNSNLATDMINAESNIKSLELAKSIHELERADKSTANIEAGRAALREQQGRLLTENKYYYDKKTMSRLATGAGPADSKDYQEMIDKGWVLYPDFYELPEDQQNNVYAVAATDPEKAVSLAQHYLKLADDEHYQKIYDWVNKDSGWQFGRRALGMVGGAAAKLASGLDPYGTMGQGMSKAGNALISGGAASASRNGLFGIEFLGGDESGISSDVPFIGKGQAGLSYQVGASVLQSVATAVPAIIAGNYSAAASKVAETIGLVLMGSSAAADDYTECIDNGMTVDQARLHATAAGVAEAAFERISLENLIHPELTTNALKRWLQQAGIEASEEVCTSIANRISDELLTDIYGVESDVDRRTRELVADGLSYNAARGKAENEWIADVIQDGMSGFLSGLIMGGGSEIMRGVSKMGGKTLNVVETRKEKTKTGAAVSRSEGSVEALQAYAKDNGIEIREVETAEQTAGESAEHGSQDGKQNSYSNRDYRSISDTNSKVVQSIRSEVRGKTVQEQQTIRDSLVEKYGEGIAPVVNNAISVETAARVRQEYGSVDSIQAARNKAVSEIKDESLRQAVSDGYDSAAYALAANQGGESGMNTMSRYIQQRRNTGSGSEMSMNATVTAQDGSTKTIAITGMSEDGKRVSLADGSEVAVKDLQADADTTSAIQQLADLDLGADATKVLEAYQQSGVTGTDGYRWLMDYATAYNQGRTRQISLEQAAQRSSLDERTVMDAYTLGQQAANRETQAGLEKLKNLPKRKGANGRTANIDTTEIKGKTMSKSELEQFELANQYAQALGVDMTWFSSKEKDGKFIGKNGAYENGTIYMDIHAGRNFTADLTSGILATMGHELTHFQQQYAPGEYQAIKEFLFEQIVKSSPNGEARLERLIWEKQKRSGNTLSRKAAEDEVVADACQKMLRDSKAVHDFASQQPEAANGVVRWLDKWFKRVRSIFGRGGNYSEEAQLMDSLEQDVKAAFGELWDKALKQAAKVHDEVGNIEKTDTEGEIQEESKAQNSDRDAEYFELAKDPEKNAARLQEMVDEAAEQAGYTKVGDYYIKNSAVPGNTSITKRQQHFFELGRQFQEQYEAGKSVEDILHMLDDTDLENMANQESGSWERFFRAGLYGDTPKYRLAIRFGNIPDGKRSINWANHTYERGVSSVNWLDENTQNEKTLYDAIYGIQGIEKQIIGGWDFGIYGSDGEPLVVAPEKIADDAERSTIKLAKVTYDDSGNVIPLSERFNEANEDIRFSERPNTDSAGRELSEGQQEYFKDSKVRDGEGHLIPVYHGTKADFHVFDFTQGGVNGTQEGFGIYLTNDKRVSDSYGDRVIEGYANIKRPATSWQKTIKRGELVKLIKTTCMQEAQRMVNDGEYDSVQEALFDTWISNYVLTYESASMEPNYRKAADVILQANSNDMDIIQEVIIGQGIRSYPAAMEFYHNALIPATGIDGFWTKWKSRGQGVDADVILAFDSNQVKNVDNLNPTDNPDIRYSERDYSTPSDEELLMNARVEDAESLEARAALQNSQKQARQIRDLTRRLERLQAEIRGYEGDSPNRISVQRFRQQALDLFGIPVGVRTDMGELLQSVADGVLAGHNLSQDDIMYFFEMLITNGKEKIVSDETLAEIRDELKGRKIYVNEDVKAEFGDDWNAFRKRAFSLGIQLTNNEKNMGIDSVNLELAELYPGKFDADETDLRSILENMVDTAESGKTSDVPILDAMRETQKQTGEPVREQLQTMLDQFTRQIEIMQDQAAVERKARAGNAAEIAKARKQINEAKEALREVRKQRDAWKRKSEGADARQKRALDAALRGIVQHDAKQIAEAVRQKQALAKKLQDQIDRENKILSGKLRAPELAKMLKAERERAETRVREQKEAQFARYKEGKKAGELRRRIVRHSKELYGKLTKPSDKRHIPEAYRGAVAALLNTINLESAYDIQEGTKNESGRGGKHVEKGTGTATNRTKAFQEVRKQLEKVLAEGGFTGELINNAAEGFDGGLIEKCQDFADKPISTLSSEELETLWNTIRALEHNITTFNKAFALAKNETISGLADSFLASAQKRKPLLKDPKSRLDLKIKKTSGAALKALENPYTFFSHYGEEGIKLYRALRNAQDLVMVRTNQLSDLWVRKMADILGDEKTAKLNGDKLTDAILDKIRDTSKQMDEKVETFKLENGQTITLTHAMLMDVYLLSQRGEVGMNHLLGSGLIQPEIRAKGKYVARDPSFRKLSLQDVQKLTEVITENATEKAVADAIQSMQHQLADWGNEASMSVFGYRKFTEDNYWPVKNAKEENKSDSGKGGNQPANAMNKGMAKNLVPHAATGVEPMSAFTKLQGSISDMLVYATWGPVMEDFKRFYNWKWLNPEGGTSDTVKGVMERYGGEGSQRYWEELRDQINNGVGGGKGSVDQLIGKAVGAVKGARVAFNLRVVVQQPTAYARAGEVISGKYLAASLLDIKSWGWKAKSAWNRALTHSPIAMRKDSTTYDMGGNISVGGEFGLDRPSRLDKARDFGTALAGKADAITWGRLWHAAELQVSAKTNLEHGSQEYWDAVNKLFTEAVDRTQVVDGLLQRPAIMRTDSDFVKGATSYMGEPLMQLNMLMRQVNDFRQTGFKATKKQIAKTVTALVVTQLFNAMLTGLYDAGIRKDDEDKDFWERFVAEITGLDGTEENAWDYITSVWLESNAASEISVMQKIPLMKDVLSMLQGYDPSNNRMDLEAIKDLIDVCTKVLWNDKYTPLHKAKEIIIKASMIFGAGFGNALKDMYGVTRNIVNDFGKPQVRFDFKALWLNPASKKNKSKYFDLLAQMVENGDKDAFRQRVKLARDDGMSDEKFFEYVHEGMANAFKKRYFNHKLEDDQAITLLMQYSWKNEKDAWNAVRKWKDQMKHVGADGKLPDDYKWNQYDELKAEVATGNDISELIQTYKANGYTETQINGAILKSIQEALTAGDLDEKEAADALIRYGVTYSKDGKTVVYDKQSAWKKVQEWADKAEHTDEEGEPEDGYKYSVYSDLFEAVDANQDAEKVIKEMVQNGGYDEDSLRSQIKEHLRERFISGQISETALKNQLSRYCKITKAEDANEIVANAKCKRDFGVYPDDLKEAFKDGDLSQNQAEKALQQYKGLSKTDAQNRVQYWSYDGDLSENAWLKWNKDLKSSGLSVENWEKVSKVKSDAKGTDANGDGRADSGTVKAEVVSYIDSMDIPKSQKKAIYLAFGWAASTMPSWR